MTLSFHKLFLIRKVAKQHTVLVLSFLKKALDVQSFLCFLSLEVLVVFGGEGNEADSSKNTLEKFTGTSWAVQILKNEHYNHAMVQLPCPVNTCYRIGDKTTRQFTCQYPIALSKDQLTQSIQDTIAMPQCTCPDPSYSAVTELGRPSPFSITWTTRQGDNGASGTRKNSNK